MTIKQRSTESGISRQTLSEWKRAGIDIFNDDELRARIGMMQTIPAGVPDHLLPNTTAPEPGGEGTTLEDLERRLYAASDYGEARTLRAQIAGIKDLLATRRQERELISLAEAKAAQFGIGVAIRSAMMALEGLLPPRLEGLDAAKMSKVIREEMRTILTRVADLDREYWPTDDELEEFIEKRASGAG